MDWLKFLRRPADLQPLVWWLRIGFIVLYWVIWVGLRGINAWTVIFLSESHIQDDYGLGYIFFPVFFHLQLDFGVFIFIELIYSAFVALHRNYTIYYLANHILFDALLIILLVAPLSSPIYIILSFLFLFLFDVLILLFFLRSKRYGFFREKDMG